MVTVQLPNKREVSCLSVGNRDKLVFTAGAVVLPSRGAVVLRCGIAVVFFPSFVLRFFIYA